jgi:hypothetical protein
MTSRLCRENSIKAPFSLENDQGDNVQSSIIHVIRCFTEQLKADEESLHRVWDSHAPGNASG